MIRDSERAHIPFYISSSGRLCRPFNHKILSVALLRLRFCSIRDDKSSLNLSVKPGTSAHSKSLSRLFCLILLLSMLITGTAAAEETLRGMVKTVHDGDTVVLVGRGIGRLTVRLYGIDAPETTKPDRPGQPYSSQARRVLMYKLLGREVTVQLREYDQYGRGVGVVLLGGRDINAEMVADGQAWAYRRFLDGPYASTYIRLEEQARRQRRGLWRDPNPQPPWEFRKTRSR